MATDQNSYFRVTSFIIMIIVQPGVIMVKGYLLLSNECTTHQMLAYKTNAYNEIH